jgi:hypothetical protein
MKIIISLFLMSILTSCNYMPAILRELGDLKVKESIEIDLESKEFPEHCNKNDVETKKL